MRSFCLWSFAVSALALVGGACFSERVGASNSAGIPDVPCDIPLSVINSGNVIVAIKNFQFIPDSVAVKEGQAVTWVNCETPGTEPHTSTDDGGAWDSPNLAPGEFFTHTFATSPLVPVFNYYCKPHPFMMGKVVVE